MGDISISSLGGAAKSTEWSMRRMSQGHAELKLRAAECKRAAQAAIDAADSSADEGTKAEFRRLAAEMVKIVEQIDVLLGDS